MSINCRRRRGDACRFACTLAPRLPTRTASRIFLSNTGHRQHRCSIQHESKRHEACETITVGDKITDAAIEPGSIRTSARVGHCASSESNIGICIILIALFASIFIFLVVTPSLPTLTLQAPRESSIGRNSNASRRRSSCAPTNDASAR